MIGFAAIYGIFCTGLNFFMGYTGQASFGQNAFAALGGYGTAILCAGQGWQPIVALPVTMVISGADRGHRRLSDAAAARPLPRDGDLRARPHHLRALDRVDRSHARLHGLCGHSAARHRQYELTSDRQQLVVLVVILLLGVWIAQRLRDSRFGRALRAIAGSEAAASALGIDVARYKLAAFVVAAVYASVAGSLFAHFIGFISPEVFGLSMVTLSLHDALSRRHRHDLGPDRRRRHRLDAAGAVPRAEGIAGHRLCGRC